jgi:hypothetical protein
MRTAHRWILALLVLGLLGTGSAWADALHGVCLSPTPACSDNGTVTPVTSQTPNYGFTISPGPQTGELLVVTLIPDNVAGAGSESFSVNGSSATLFNSTPWTSGFLAAYLGGSATPKNPIGAYLPTTDSFDSGATGYFVYTTLLSGTLTDPSDPGATLALSDGSFVLPLGTSIVGFFEASGSDDVVATANSAQLSIEGGGTPPTGVPEPGSLMLMGAGFLSMAGIVRRRFIS